MKDLRIYIANHCKKYYEDGYHHALCEVPVKEAVQLITDEKIIDNDICAKTVIDMRDCIIELLKELDNR